ncbi:MAG: pre-peptidase C-terminal domain-containing protein [Pleurocapsa sp.]
MLKIGTFGVYCRILLPILTVATSFIFNSDPAFGVNFRLKQQLPSTRKLIAQVESTDNSDRALEWEILSEINRARTDPQAYAAWLQEQKQYYDGILLKLPGEKPVRTNKWLKALTAAIDFLQQQEPLPNLTITDELSTTAASKLAHLNKIQTAENFNSISYGKLTATGVVMQLIVDHGFGDRRDHNSIFNPDLDRAGIVCQDDETYENICAITYAGESLNIAAQADIPQSTSSSESEENSTETLPTPQPNLASDDPSDVIVTENSNSVNNDLPAVPEIEVPNLAANPPSNLASEEVEANQIENTNESGEPPEVAVSTVENNTESEAESAESDDSFFTANLLEKTERGVLKEGDSTIPDDGSYYHSYPLEGNAGDSFIITLESEDFDTFLAILDAEGNIIDQNDDIDNNNSNSRLRVTLPDDGVYNIIVNSYEKGGQGRYTLTIRR